MLKNTNSSLLRNASECAYGVSLAKHEKLILVSGIPWSVKIGEEELQLMGPLIVRSNKVLMGFSSEIYIRDGHNMQELSCILLCHIVTVLPSVFH